MARPNLRLVPRAPRPVAALRFVDLTPELLTLAAASEIEPRPLTPEIVRAAMAPGLAFAAFDNGMVISAGGIAPLWHGMAQGWLMVTTFATVRHMAAVTRFARQRFDEWNAMPAYRRIEMQVRADRPWRQSFAARLGMTECWGPMRAWDAQGRDYYLYARVA